LRSGADRGEIESARPDPTELQGVLPGGVDDAVDDVSRPERQRVAAAGELDAVPPTIIKINCWRWGKRTQVKLIDTLTVKFVSVIRWP
jgi:hypothetical protein